MEKKRAWPGRAKGFYVCVGHSQLRKEGKKGEEYASTLFGLWKDEKGMDILYLYFAYIPLNKKYGGM